MATVTKKFRDDFETWAAHRVATGKCSSEEIESVREMLRADLAPGPDHLRAGLSVAVGGVAISAAIDDHEERYRLWADYFATEAECIRTIRKESAA